MQSLEGIRSFNSSLAKLLEQTCEHDPSLNPASVVGIDGCGCPCRRRFLLETRAYEACIPRDMWNKTKADIYANLENFEAVVEVHSNNLNKALRNGYGYALCGDNGSGKTMFLSWELIEILLKTPYTVYYTTAPQLAHDHKMGFDDKERRKRLEEYLSRDFVVFDELGKEKYKNGDDYMRTVLELWLRKRNDNSMPILIGSNMDAETLRASPGEGGYGETFGSLLDGKFEVVNMDPGDYRVKLGDKVRKEMGYK